MRWLNKIVLGLLCFFVLMGLLTNFTKQDILTNLILFLILFYLGRLLFKKEKVLPIKENEKFLNNEDNASKKQNIFSKIRNNSLDTEIQKKKHLLEELNYKIKEANLELEFIDYGLYKRKYKFSDSDKYKDALAKIRLKEKDLIKNNSAGLILTPMKLDNSLSKGKTMQNQLIKAMLRGFNGEADSLLSKITTSNSDNKIKALKRIFEQINKLYKRNEVAISERYLKLKIKELELAAEYELIKQEEKDLLREQRAKEREDKKLQEEIKRKRVQLEKDRAHYMQMIENVEKMIKNATEDQKPELLKQLSSYQDKISELEEIEEDIDYREGHATAGYVYVISNIGSFGEDIYKIGVTRRLEPLERIAELSSASVPFKFDVHALMFSEDAFALESELHRELDAYRVNKVNSRKEYFKVPFSKIKDILDSHKELTVEITESPEAYEYRQSLANK
ncbi:DUF4041 domain-containing protein [Facklamia sp. P13064]|uniref:DUF4041 domain-containing protein n=1 Tax=Facklamia sp. P13064 TaxID=3421953 RepID=UPI003D179647